MRGSGQPLSGLRDLLAPVGGLFKGAFGVPSNEGGAQDASSLPKPGSSHHDNRSTAPETSPERVTAQACQGSLEQMPHSQQTGRQTKI